MLLTPEHLRQSSRAALPFATALMATAVDALPLPSAAPDEVAPVTLLSVVFFWSIHRPELLGAGAIFCIALLNDGLVGLPLGMTALAFLLTRTILLPKDMFLATRPFMVVWACFALTTAVALGFRWLIASIWWGYAMPLWPSIFEAFLTLLTYPLISTLLATMITTVPKTRHASGS